MRSDGTLLAVENGTSVGPGRDSPLYAFIIPTSGTYFVSVAPTVGNGAYSLDVYLSTDTPPPASAQSLDYYSFDLGAGDSASLVLKGLTGVGLDVSLQNSSGIEVSHGTPAGTNYETGIRNFIAPTAGTYYAVINGTVQTQYDLVVTRNADFDTEANDSLATAQALSGNSAALGYSSNSDYFSVQLAGGATLNLATATPGGGPFEFSNLLDPRLELYDPSGNLVATDDNSASDGRNAVLSYTATTGGNYRILVASAGGTTGEYLLRTETVGHVVASHVFYNRSIFDGNGAAANAADDAALDTSKSPLLPGGTASFANYTSYSRGLNGVMVDIGGLAGPPTAADFEFRVGNDSTPAGWVLAPAPTSITVRAGAGVGGSDRVTLVWADNAIENQWLQVTIKATPTTRLASDEVFYFGNAIGETGNTAGNAFVNSTDEIAIRNAGSPAATLASPLDIDRNGIVDDNDEAVARAHRTTFLNALKLIAAPSTFTLTSTTPEVFSDHVGLITQWFAVPGVPPTPPGDPGEVEDEVTFEATFYSTAVSSPAITPRESAPALPVVVAEDTSVAPPLDPIPVTRVEPSLSTAAPGTRPVSAFVPAMPEPVLATVEPTVSASPVFSFAARPLASFEALAVPETWPALSAAAVAHVPDGDPSSAADRAIEEWDGVLGGPVNLTEGLSRKRTREPEDWFAQIVDEQLLSDLAAARVERAQRVHVGR
jgi:hypothetical protein